MVDAELEKIVMHCLAMDEQAVTVYAAFAEGSREKGLATFWRRMEAEEKSHVKNWQGVLTAVRGGKFPQIFDNPVSIARDLEARRRKIEEMQELIGGQPSMQEQFCLAYRMEFYVLHPALERLWRFYGILEGMAVSPEKGYELHIGNFISAMRRFGITSPELELLGESVQFIWEQVRVLGRETDEDELTKVLNRRCLFNSMRALANFAQRNRFACGVMFIDLDEFKGINDRLGHQAGDQALVDVARAIRTSVRASDLVGRYGGDEFLVFLPQVEAGNLAGLAEKVRLTVSGCRAGGAPVTVSVGAAGALIGHDQEHDLATLIGKADEALLAAKSAGRNRVVCADGENMLRDAAHMAGSAITEFEIGRRG
jgi:diguanylate cyclase (GGDEF)-like protein